MSEPANSDPLELVPLPADFLNVDAAIKMSLLESSGIRFLLKGQTYWGSGGRQTLLVARRDYEDAMRVVGQTPQPFLVEPPVHYGASGGDARGTRRSSLPLVLCALFLAWVLYGVLKARF